MLTSYPVDLDSTDSLVHQIWNNSWKTDWIDLVLAYTLDYGLTNFTIPLCNKHCT